MDTPALTARFRARGVGLVEVGTEGLHVPSSFGGSLAEQRATRRGVGLFDFSFMACLDIHGPQALAFLERLQTRNPARLPPGRLAYTLLLRQDATVLIDATLWRIGPERFRLVSGRRTDIDHVRALAQGYDVKIEDHSSGSAVIAAQGPKSPELLRRCGVRVPPSFFRFGEDRVLGHRCLIARVGYTGELGYELFVDAAAAAELWDGLVVAGADLGLLECGFEAADALRIEAGFILFSRELALPVTPYEIGFGRLLDAKGPFLGASALASMRRREPVHALVGLLPAGAAEARSRGLSTPRWPLPHAGEALLTSAARSALYGIVIAMGFVRAADRHPGTRVRLSTGASARVARLPFYDPVKRLARSPA